MTSRARPLSRRVLLAGAAAAGAGNLAWHQTRVRTDGGDWLEVNGDRQWLGVRGRSGPVVLVLHGGPGASETALFRTFNASLEHHARVACWDQRGAGRSFDPDAPPTALSVAQHVADCAEVVAQLKRRHGAPVVLLGHSWGSMLGLLTLRAHPGLASGFIGVGQVADQGAQEQAAYAFALDEARRRGHDEAVAALTAIGPPPHSVPHLMVKNAWVEAFGGYFAPGFSKTRAALEALLGGRITVAEALRTFRANEHTLRLMWPEVRGLDLTSLVTGVEVPVAFLLGRHDRHCSSRQAADYFDRLAAPDKRIVWFERSAHNPPFEEPERFDAVVAGLLAAWRLLG